MKYYFLLISLLLFRIAGAQVAHVSLSGTLTMATGEQFPYKIEGVDSGGLLRGYAWTYNEPDQTKVTIKGRIDKQAKKLIFKEVEIVSSHSVQTKAFMCLIHATLDYRQGTLSGSVTSMESDNTACTPGVLTFSKSDEINELFSSHDKYDQVITMGGNKETVKPRKEVAEPVTADVPIITDKVTAGIEKTYEWHSDSMIIDVWDGGTFDGDMVTIEFDGKPILKRFIIDKPKKRIRVAIPDEGVHTLAIIADNEGTDPPNTANMMLFDRDIKYSIVAYNDKGQQSLIKIKKVKK